MSKAASAVLGKALIYSYPLGDVPILLTEVNTFSNCISEFDDGRFVNWNNVIWRSEEHFISEPKIVKFDCDPSCLFSPGTDNITGNLKVSYTIADIRFESAVHALQEYCPGSTSEF